ncbi:MAG: universal stress protein, partial [Myxococcota bacterium]
TIKTHAAEADLVVMGLRGETEESFPKQGGEMAAWITQHVAVPVLFGTKGTRQITNIAVGYDGSESSKRAIAAVRRFLAPLALPIHAIHVSQDGSGEAILSEVDEQLPGCTIQHHAVTAPSIEDGLVDKALDLGAEVLVMGFSGQSAVKDFLFGTCTERVLISGELAVMVTH